jgi:hypothetical protein
MAPPKGHEPYPGCETGGRPIIWTDEKIEEEATLLIQYAKNPESLVLGKHYGERGYHSWHAMYWSKRNSVFDDAKKLALTIVGARREELAIKGLIHDAMVRKYAGVYDPEIKQYELDLKQKETETRNSDSMEILNKIFDNVESKKNSIKKNEDII